MKVWMRSLLLLTISLTLAACATTSQPKLEVFDNIERADRAYERSQWIEAERYYQAVTQAVPNDAYAWFRLGNVHLRQGRLAQAVAMYQEALQRDERQAKPYFNMATAHLLQAHQALTAALAHVSPLEQAQLTTRLQQLEVLLYGELVEGITPGSGSRSVPEKSYTEQSYKAEPYKETPDPQSSELIFSVPNGR